MHRAALALVVAALILTGLVAPTPAAAQDDPILAVISWDGSPGREVDRLLRQGQLPNVRRLAQRGVHVRRTVGSWPSVTPQGHAAVATGAYGNVNGITGAQPRLPEGEGTIAEFGPSDFSAENLEAEPLWVTAARQGRSSTTVSWPQGTPFEMYTSADYVSSQGARAFGDFSERLLLSDPYRTAAVEPAAIDGGGDGVAIQNGAAGWRNLPRGARFRSFSLGRTGGSAPGDLTLRGLLVAPDGRRFTQMALSPNGDYRRAEILRVSPFRNSAAAFTDPLPVTLCDGPDSCVTGFTHFRLTDLAADGSAFALWHSYHREASGYSTDESRIPQWLALGSAFTGNGPSLPEPFSAAPDLPNVLAETAFLVNEYQFGVLTSEIERNEDDVFFGYSPYPDEWHHAFFSYLFRESPYFDNRTAARARAYQRAMYRNLDAHLGEIVRALRGTGRPWNVVLTTDHGFEPQWREFVPNRVLRQAGLLSVDDAGEVDVAGTQAYYAGSGAVRINTPERFRGGTVSAEEYDGVVARVRSAFRDVRDPTTGERIVLEVHRAADREDEGLGGPHGADLYLEVVPGGGYSYGSTAAGDGPVVEEGERYSGGFHGGRTSGNELQQGFAVLGGDGFRDGLVAARARSIDLIPTAAHAVGLAPAAHWRGTTWEDWVAAR